MLVTLILFFAARMSCQEEQKGGYFPDIVTGLINAFGYIIAFIVSLIAWLIYFIIF